MKRIKARDVLHFSEAQMRALDPGDYLVEFDNGEVPLTQERLIISWFTWCFQRHYKEIPLNTQHCIGNMDIDKSTTIKLLERGYYDTFDALGRDMKLIHILNPMTYKATSEIQNFTTDYCMRYVYTLDYRDYADILKIPSIRAQLDRLREPGILRTEVLKRIDETYSLVTDEILNNPLLDNNPVADAMRAGFVPGQQVLQIVGLRGTVTERNGDLFMHPILRGYLEGFRTLHDGMVCSREATKALGHQRNLLQDVEYINRKFQLVGSIIRNIHDGDCGSEEAIRWTVTGDFLKSHAGKYFRMAGDKGPFDQVIYPNRTDLEGKVVEFRSSWGCHHPDPLGCCSKCFGELFYQIPPGSNVGHVANVNLNNKGASVTLATKHLDFNAVMDSLELSLQAQRYLTIVDSTQHIMLSSRLKGKQIKLRFVGEEAPELVSVEKARDLYSVKPQEVSNLSTIKLIITDQEGLVEEARVDVHSGNRSSSFTMEALLYIKEHGAITLPGGEKEIDLSHWNFNQSLFELPMRQSNMLDYMNLLENIIKSTREHNKKLKRSSFKRLVDFDDPIEALKYFNKVLRSKLHVNFAYVEIMLMAYRARDPDNNDYYPAKGLYNGKIISRADAIRERSMAVPMAYQGHKFYLQNPSSFNHTERPPSVLDSFIMGSSPIED